MNGILMENIQREFYEWANNFSFKNDNSHWSLYLVRKLRNFAVELDSPFERVLLRLYRFVICKEKKR
jgi:hypothetical protein